MAGTKGVRLAKVAREINVGIDTITQHLKKKGFEVENKPTTKLTQEMYELLIKDFKGDINLKQRAEEINFRSKREEVIIAEADKGKDKVPPSNEKEKSETPPPSPIDEPVSPKLTTSDTAQPEEERPIVPVNKVEDVKPEVEKVKEVTPPVVNTIPTPEPKPTTELPPVTSVSEPKSDFTSPPVKDKTIITTPTPSNVVPPPKMPPIEPIKEKKEEVIAPKPLDKAAKTNDAPVNPPVEQEKKSTPETDKQQPKQEQKEKQPEPQQKIKESTPKKETPITKMDVSELESPKVLGKIDLTKLNQSTRPVSNKKQKKQFDSNKQKPKHNRENKPEKQEHKTRNEKKTNTPPPPKPVVPIVPKQPKVKRIEDDENFIKTAPAPQLAGPKVVGKINLPDKKELQAQEAKRKRKRKRIVKNKTAGNNNNRNNNNRGSNNNNNNNNNNRGSNNNNNNNNNRGSNNNNNNNNRGTNNNRGPNTGGNRTGGNNNNRNTTSRGNSSNRVRGGDPRKRNRRNKKADPITEVSEKEIQDKIKATMAKMSGGGRSKNTRAKLRRQKRDIAAGKREEESAKTVENLLQVTEFISVSELAKIMEVPVTNVITVCFNLGIIVSINQRLDAEIIEVVASEFDFEVEFISVTAEDEEEEEEEVVTDEWEDRPPIVTIMGHVDHGKTSLLDYIRNANVVAGEMGGITQHIGAYEVTTSSGRQITFLDTPGHEAFTAMRARGAKITDIAVIVVAADDSVMPQTKEAISHAQAADVPMVFAINKIDREESNPDKIKEQLSQMNLLVEDWGGKYQSQDISAKQGLNIDDLLEKVLLEADILELKANPNRQAVGTVIEATLDKGRGYSTTVLIQKGTLKIGDIIIAGQYNGRVRAMFNERGTNIKEAGPSTPVLILGLNGAPQAGDMLRQMPSEQDARELALKRQQIMREQQQRASKHITLDEIGRRLALGNFKELNLIVKGDVDGSVEALSDSLLKLSTEEIQVRIIHKSVGAITEGDVLLASASDAIIIGFQVRPSANARRQAEQENIDIRMYSIIYDAIDEIRSAMEGMLEPKVEERFVCNIEVRDVFKITRVGTVAGCYVTEGKVARDTKIRLIRDGIVKYTGEISALKRYKDDVKEVLPGMECGISIKNYNDIKVGDVIEGYEEIEIKRTL